MKATIPTEPNKFKELVCVLLGHEWNSNGSTHCQKHAQRFNVYSECERCGLRKHGLEYCPVCYDEMFAKIKD
jgi:hypothetical protein